MIHEIDTIAFASINKSRPCIFRVLLPPTYYYTGSQSSSAMTSMKTREKSDNRDNRKKHPPGYPFGYHVDTHKPLLL